MGTVGQPIGDPLQEFDRGVAPPRHPVGDPVMDKVHEPSPPPADGGRPVVECRKVGRLDAIEPSPPATPLHSDDRRCKRAV